MSLNIDVGLQYLAAWLSGNGCVPIYNLMEDAATAEISRAQVWQWLRHGARLDDGRADHRVAGISDASTSMSENSAAAFPNRIFLPQPGYSRS